METPIGRVQNHPRKPANTADVGGALVDQRRTPLHRLQHIVEIMRDPTSQLPQRLHPFGMCGTRPRCRQCSLISFSFSNIGECADEAALGQALGANFQHHAIRAGALIGVRPGRDEIRLQHIVEDFITGFRQAELLMSMLPVDDLLKDQPAAHHARRQTKQADGAMIEHRDDTTRADHHDALRHVLQRHRQGVARIEQRLPLTQHHDADDDAAAGQQDPGCEIQPHVPLVGGEHIL